MRSPQFDALLAALKGVLDSELQYRRALLKLTDIHDDSDLGNAVRSRRDEFTAEIEEIRRYAEALGLDGGPQLDDQIFDVGEDDGQYWEIFTRR